MSRLLIAFLILFFPLPAFSEPMVSVWGQQAPISIARKFAQVNDLVNQEKYQEAEPLARTLVKEAPNLGVGHLMLSRILHQKSMTREAYEEAKLAVKLNPKYANSYICLGNCAMALGKSVEAIQAYKTFKRLNPKAPQTKKIDGLIATLNQKVEMDRKISTKSPPGTYLAQVTVYGVNRFSEDKFPVKVFIEKESAAKGFQPAFYELFKNSFLKWQNEASGVVSFSFVEDPEMADIECRWTDDVSKLMNPAEGGHTMFSDGPEGRQSAEIVVFTVAKGKLATSAQIERICLHEIGHAIGLSGHSSDPGDIMFLSLETSKALLSKRDIATLKALYQMKPSRPKVASGEANNRFLLNSKRHQASTLNNEGNVLARARQYEQAIAKFERAISLDPKLSTAKYNLGITENAYAVKLAEDKKYNQAVVHIKKSIAVLKSLNDKAELETSLKNHIGILQRMNRIKEAEAVALELRDLESR